MTVTYLGSMTVGQAVPVALAASATIQSAAAPSLADLQAKIAGMTAMLSNIALHPPSIVGSLAAAQALVTSLTAQIALSVPTPPLDPSAILALLAALEAELAALNATLAFATSLSATLATGGLFAYRYDGAVSSLGSDFSSALSSGLAGGPPDQPVHAIALIAADPTAWAAIQSVFRVA